MTKGQLEGITSERLIKISRMGAHDLSTYVGYARHQMQHVAKGVAQGLNSLVDNKANQEMTKPAEFIDYAKSYGKVAWAYTKYAVGVLKNYAHKLKGFVKGQIKEQKKSMVVKVNHTEAKNASKLSGVKGNSQVVKHLDDRGNTGERRVSDRAPRKQKR